MISSFQCDAGFETVTSQASGHGPHPDPCGDRAGPCGSGEDRAVLVRRDSAGTTRRRPAQRRDDPLGVRVGRVARLHGDHRDVRGQAGHVALDEVTAAHEEHRGTALHGHLVGEGVVLPRTSPPARLREVGLADLAGHGLILPPKATAPGWHDHVLEICARHGFTPSRLRHARNPEFLLGLVLGGHGVAFEQEALARREPRVAWRPLTDRPLLRSVSAAWPADLAHPATARFASIAADVLAAEHTPPSPAAPTMSRPWSVVFTAGR